MGSMHITSVDVISLNGKITRGVDADAHTWSSAEDWEQFTKLRDSHQLLVMGSGSYDSVQPSPEAGRLRVVLTHHPQRYADRAVPGQLEFVNTSPQELIEQFAARGFTTMLLLGAQVNTQFWATGLVNEAYVTVEPLVFGRGRQLLDGADFAASMRLESCTQLNDRGTLLLHYLVDKIEPHALS